MGSHPLSNCVEGERVPTTEEILTLMDSADPQPDGLYIDSLSNLVDFGIKDAMDIHHTEEYFLGTFDELGQGGAHKMHKYTWNKILVPLDLVSTKLESVETFVDMTDQ